MSKVTLLITGGCGFIGSNFIHYMAERRPECNIINLDKLTYSGNQDNLKGLNDSSHYRFVQGDIRDEELVTSLFRENDVQAVIHFAAESHVDRSILNAKEFVRTNVEGTHVLLETATHYWRERLSNDPSFRFVHISTDEIYGTLGQYGLFREDNPLKPNSPYSATKAGADLLARAYFETYELPVLIVRPSNNYGPYQYPEKFIPLMIANLMEDRRVPIYGKGLNVRDWIFVTDTCQAISAIFEKGKPGQAYNVGGESEKRNIDVAQDLLHLFNKDESSLEFVTDRPGHDLRYALDNAKIRTELKWAPVTKFEKGIRETVAWYQANEWWWKPLKERLSKESKGFWSGS